MERCHLQFSRFSHANIHSTWNSPNTWCLFRVNAKKSRVISSMWLFHSMEVHAWRQLSCVCSFLFCFTHWLLSIHFSMYIYSPVFAYRICWPRFKKLVCSELMAKSIFVSHMHQRLSVMTCCYLLRHCSLSRFVLSRCPIGACLDRWSNGVGAADPTLVLASGTWSVISSWWE